MSWPTVAVFETPFLPLLVCETALPRFLCNCSRVVNVVCVLPSLKRAVKCESFRDAITVFHILCRGLAFFEPSFLPLLVYETFPSIVCVVILSCPCYGTRYLPRFLSIVARMVNLCVRPADPPPNMHYISGRPDRPYARNRSRRELHTVHGIPYLFSF